MPEDGFFEFERPGHFKDDQGRSLADEAAFRAELRHQFNKIAAENSVADQHQDKALDAVQRALDLKYGDRGDGTDDVDPPGSTDGSDFFL